MNNRKRFPVNAFVGPSGILMKKTHASDLTPCRISSSFSSGSTYQTNSSTYSLWNKPLPKFDNPYVNTYDKRCKNPHDNTYDNTYDKPYYNLHDNPHDNSYDNQSVVLPYANRRFETKCEIFPEITERSNVDVNSMHLKTWPMFQTNGDDIQRTAQFYGFVKYEQINNETLSVNCKPEQYNKDTTSLSQQSDRFNKDTTSMSHQSEQFNKDTTMSQTSEQYNKDTTSMSHQSEQLNKDTTSMSHQSEQFNKDTTSMSHQSEQLNKDTTSMSHQSEQFNKDTTPMSHQSEQYNKDTTPMSHQSEQFNKDTTMSQTSEQYNKDTTSMSHQSEQFNKDTTSMSRPPEQFNKDTTSMNHQSEQFNKDTTSMSHQSEQYNKDTTSMNHQSEQLNKDTTSMNHQSEQFNKDTTSMSRPPEQFNKDTTSMNHQSEQFNKDTTSMSHQSEQYNKDTTPMSHESEHFNKDTTSMSHQSKQYNKDTTSMSHQSEQYNKDTTSMSHQSEQYNKDTTPMSRPSEQFNKDKNGTTLPVSEQYEDSQNDTTSVNVQHEEGTNDTTLVNEEGTNDTTLSWKLGLNDAGEYVKTTYPFFKRYLKVTCLKLDIASLDVSNYRISCENMTTDLKTEQKLSEGSSGTNKRLSKQCSKNNLHDSAGKLVSNPQKQPNVSHNDKENHSRKNKNECHTPNDQENSGAVKTSARKRSAIHSNTSHRSVKQLSTDKRKVFDKKTCNKELNKAKAKAGSLKDVKSTPTQSQQTKSGGALRHSQQTKSEGTLRHICQQSKLKNKNKTGSNSQDKNIERLSSSSSSKKKTCKKSYSLQKNKSNEISKKKCCKQLFKNKLNVSKISQTDRNELGKKMDTNMNHPLNKKSLSNVLQSEKHKQTEKNKMASIKNRSEHALSKKDLQLEETKNIPGLNVSKCLQSKKMLLLNKQENNISKVDYTNKSKTCLSHKRKKKDTVDILSSKRLKTKNSDKHLTSVRKEQSETSISSTPVKYPSLLNQKPVRFNIVAGSEAVRCHMQLRTCVYCHTFITRLAGVLRDHVKEKHKFKCMECHVAFPDKLTAKQHRLHWHQIQQHHCTQCRKTFPSACAYRKHASCQQHATLLQARTHIFVQLMNILSSNNAEFKSIMDTSAETSDNLTTITRLPILTNKGKVMTSKGKVTPIMTSKGKVTPITTNKGKVTPVVSSKGKVTPVITSKGKVTPIMTSKGKVTPVVTSKGKITPSRCEDVQQVKHFYYYTPLDEKIKHLDLVLQKEKEMDIQSSSMENLLEIYQLSPDVVVDTVGDVAAMDDSVDDAGGAEDTNALSFMEELGMVFMGSSLISMLQDQDFTNIQELQKPKESDLVQMERTEPATCNNSMCGLSEHTGSTVSDMPVLQSDLSGHCENSQMPALSLSWSDISDRTENCLPSSVSGLDISENPSSNFNFVSSSEVDVSDKLSLPSQTHNLQNVSPSISLQKYSNVSHDNAFKTSSSNVSLNIDSETGLSNVSLNIDSESSSSDVSPAFAPMMISSSVLPIHSTQKQDDQSCLQFDTYEMSGIQFPVLREHVDNDVKSLTPVTTCEPFENCVNFLTKCPVSITVPKPSENCVNSLTKTSVSSAVPKPSKNYPNCFVTETSASSAVSELSEKCVNSVPMLLSSTAVQKQSLVFRDDCDNGLNFESKTMSERSEDFKDQSNNDLSYSLTKQPVSKVIPKQSEVFTGCRNRSITKPQTQNLSMHSFGILHRWHSNPCIGVQASGSTCKRKRGSWRRRMYGSVQHVCAFSPHPLKISSRVTVHLPVPLSVPNSPSQESYPNSSQSMSSRVTSHFPVPLSIPDSPSDNCLSPPTQRCSSIDDHSEAESDIVNSQTFPSTTIQNPVNELQTVSNPVNRPQALSSFVNVSQPVTNSVNHSQTFSSPVNRPQCVPSVSQEARHTIPFSNSKECRPSVSDVSEYSAIPKHSDTPTHNSVLESAEQILLPFPGQTTEGFLSTGVANIRAELMKLLHEIEESEKNSL